MEDSNDEETTTSTKKKRRLSPTRRSGPPSGNEGHKVGPQILHSSSDIFRTSGPQNSHTYRATTLPLLTLSKPPLSLINKFGSHPYIVKLR
jgi:hypothetical protein